MPSRTAPNTPYPITAPQPQSLPPARMARNPLYATPISSAPAKSNKEMSARPLRRNEPITRITATSSDSVDTIAWAQIGARQSSSPRTFTPFASRINENSF